MGNNKLEPLYLKWIRDNGGAEYVGWTDFRHIKRSGLSPLVKTYLSNGANVYVFKFKLDSVLEHGKFVQDDKYDHCSIIKITKEEWLDFKEWESIK